MFYPYGNPVKIQNRFDSFIENQFAKNLGNIIRELISNGVDAVLKSKGKTEIGMFGKGGSLGVLSSISKIKTESDTELKLVAVNKNDGHPVNAVEIKPTGKTFGVNVDHKTIDTTNYPDNSTTVAVYPNGDFLRKLQDLRISGLQDDVDFLPELNNFRFLKDVLVFAEIYNETGELSKSLIVNPGESENEDRIILRVFVDHFEVINPSSDSSLHPISFYHGGVSSKERNKNVETEIEVLKEPNLTINFLGPGGVVAAENPINPNQNNLHLSPDSFVSLNLTLPLSLDVDRGSGTLEKYKFGEIWSNLLAKTKDQNSKPTFVKILNTLHFYISNLNQTSPNYFLKNQCLKQVTDAAKETVDEICEADQNTVILPNLKAFERVETMQDSTRILVQVAFLENYKPAELLEAVDINSEVVNGNSKTKVLGANFRFAPSSYYPFLIKMRQIQTNPQAILDLNLPFLGIPSAKNPREYDQIWLPKSLIENLNQKYISLKNEFQNLIQNKNLDYQNLTSQLKIQTEEYDQFISLIQIICSPKTSYETNFTPPVDFKTSKEIHDELLRQQKKSETRLTFGQQDLDTEYQIVDPLLDNFKREFRDELKQVTENPVFLPTAQKIESAVFESLQGLQLGEIIHWEQDSFNTIQSEELLTPENRSLTVKSLKIVQNFLEIEFEGSETALIDLPINLGLGVKNYSVVYSSGG